MMLRAGVLFGILLHGLCYLFAARLAVALVGSDSFLMLALMLLLMFAAELGPLRWTDRVTGVTAWRERRSAVDRHLSRGV